jgi:ABC-2 type transport system permease protein
MNNLPLLLKREYWEHRGGFLWTPVWMTASILILTVLGILSAEVFRANAHVHMGFSLDDLRGSISENDLIHAGNALDMAQVMFTGIASIGLFFVLFFYLLGALYDDRRDRSVLFWKSLPVTDTATVVSKALSAALVAPVIAFAVATAAYLVFLVLVCIWAGAHGLNALPAVMAAHPIGMFWRLALTVPINALWALPAIGWLLFWSAYVRSKPFLWAVLIPFLVLIANWWLDKLGAPHIAGDLNLAAMVGRLLLSIMPGSWIGSHGSGMLGRHVGFNMEDNHVVSSFDPSRVYSLLAEPNLWIGVVAGAALIVAAIWFRQRRIETAS